MAQKSDFDNSIDNTDNSTSLQRMRNNLTLKEKVAVIEAYDRQPVYKKVARMFNCSWEQIKNIIANRDAIIEFYKATVNEKLDEKKDDMELDVKERKLKFLGECVYESIKRLHYHTKQPVTEELIRLKAFEFQDILKICDFQPNKKWLNIFKNDYNISLANKQIALHVAPPSSTDLKDIMTFCMKQKAQKINNSLQFRYNKFETNGVEYENKRLRKLNFLQEALNEYMLRVRFHHKSIQLTTMMMRKIAIEFNEILKVQDFKPTLEWVDTFMKNFDSQLKLDNIKKPPLSLDLIDILTYCSCMQNKTKTHTITLAPKENALQMRILPKVPGNDTSSDPCLKCQQNPNTNLYENAEKDIKPNIEEIQIEQSLPEKQPPLKIRKIESINNDAKSQRKVLKSKKSSGIPMIEVPRKLCKDFPKQKIVHTNEPTNTANIQIKEEIVWENDFILPTITGTSPTISTTRALTTTPTIVKQENNAATTATIDNETEVELPRHVTSFKDILLLLKPLEEYAMLKENYRAIGLITQLEEVFKNQPVEEEFISNNM